MEESEKEYLTFSELQVSVESLWETVSNESKGCEPRKYFKVDDNGFIYVTAEKPLL